MRKLITAIVLFLALFQSSSLVAQDILKGNDLSTVRVDYLSDGDIAKVKSGASVDIFIEALNENVSGKVVGISPRADMVGGDVVFKVTIAFDQQPENALWGMTAEVTIEE